MDSHDICLLDVFQSYAVAVVSETSPTPSRSLARQTLVSTCAFLVLAVVCHWIFGPFTGKRGIFLHGIHSESEYRSIIKLYQGRSPTQAITLSQHQEIHVAPDGSCDVVSNIAYACRGNLTRCLLRNMSNFPENTRALTRQGAVLTLTRDTSDPPDFTIDLPHQNLPVQQFVLESSLRFPKAPWIQHKGPRWEYTFQQMYGPPIHYTQTVTFPRGAKIVSCEPDPAGQTTQDDKPRITFDQDLKNGQTFRCHLVYDLPD